MPLKLEGLRRKYEAARKEWKDESQGRKRLQKQRPIEQNRHESKAREAAPHHRIGDNSTEIASELMQDGVRVIRSQLTADRTISIVYPVDEKLGQPGTANATTPALEARAEQCTTQETPLEHPEATVQGSCPAHDETDTTSYILTEDFPSLPASPLFSTPEDHAPIANTPTATRRTSASSSLTFESAFPRPGNRYLHRSRPRSQTSRTQYSFRLSQRRHPRLSRT